MVSNIFSERTWHVSREGLIIQPVYYRIAGYFRRRNFRTSATILIFEELNFAQRHDFENKFSFLLWTNKSFVEFIFEDNVLNEIFENKFPLKITCIQYLPQIQPATGTIWHLLWRVNQQECFPTNHITLWPAQLLCTYGYARVSVG